MASILTAILCVMGHLCDIGRLEDRQILFGPPMLTFLGAAVMPDLGFWLLIGVIPMACICLVYLARVAGTLYPVTRG